MKPVIVISPFSAKTLKGKRDNIAYAEQLVADCIRRGEAPFASHLLYPRVLDDDNPEERTLGMQAGWAWFPVVAAAGGKAVVGVDRAMSSGMAQDIEAAKRAGLHVEYRSLKVELGDESSPTTRTIGS